MSDVRNDLNNWNDLNNYRPISVISIVAKVFERVIYDQLYAYLEEQDIISSDGKRCLVIVNDV